MVSMVVSKTIDVGSIPATPAKKQKITTIFEIIWLYQEKVVSLHRI